MKKRMIISVVILLISVIFSVVVSAEYSWTECVSLNGKNCDILCEERGMEASNACTPTRGGTACMELWGNEGCDQESSSSTHPCLDSIIIHDAEWKCCCGGTDVLQPPQIISFEITESDDQLTVYVNSEDDTGIEKITLDSPIPYIHECDSQTQCECYFNIDLSTNEVTGNVVRRTGSRCGDGICDSKEQKAGICPKDCKKIVRDAPSPNSKTR